MIPHEVSVFQEELDFTQTDHVSCNSKRQYHSDMKKSSSYHEGDLKIRSQVSRHESIVTNILINEKWYDF